LKIAISNGPGWLAGGVEIYLKALIPALIESGHEVAIGYSKKLPNEQYWPKGIASYNLSSNDSKFGIKDFFRWGADLHYIQSIKDLKFWDRVADSKSVSVYFAHNYLSTCISGQKFFKFPTIESCNRCMGLACLLHYLPRRCGGLSPITMFRDFFKKSLLLQRVSKADHVITHSESMLRELKNNLNTDRISRIPFYVYFSNDEVTSRISEKELSIFFAARLEKEKGAHILLKSLPLVARKVNKKLRVVIAGEGSQKSILESISKDICAKESDIKIHFPGWLNHRDKLYEFSRSNVFAMPCLWPEPLGMAPLEALCHGVPVVGFPGGYSEFLDNTKSSLVVDERSVSAFSKALCICLTDTKYMSNAKAQVPILRRRFSMDNHMKSLNNIFNTCLTS